MKGALLVGIDNYNGPARLYGCVNDAVTLGELLEANENDTHNFTVTVKKNVPTRAMLRSLLITFFQSNINMALFYFSGHGCVNARGGFIVTPDAAQYDEGISMDEILNIINQSPIKDKIVILDCCHAGAFGNPVSTGSAACYLTEGVTILTSSRSTEASMEVDGHGLFTELLLNALKGGAADIEGNITPGSVYAYIDRSLSLFEQRPLFKTNVSRFTVLRTVKPALPIKSVLKMMTEYFSEDSTYYKLDPSYEFTNTEVAKPANVAIFQNLQKMRAAGLVVPDKFEHMYEAAQNSTGCTLTMLGKHYWRLVKEGKI